MALTRQQQINAILRDLKSYKPKKDEIYAVHENILFYEAARGVLSFLKWQLFHAPHINATKLLELADLPFPNWETAFYEQLNSVERKNFPGLLKPLANYLAGQTGELFLDLGCGSMELERQVISSLQKVHDTRRRIFIGLDISPSSFEMVKRTFRNFTDEVHIQNISEISPTELKELQLKYPTKHLVVFVQKDARELHLHLKPNSVDVVYSSKFKHHLPDDFKTIIDEAMTKVGRHVIEFDDYRTPTSWIPQAFTAWKKPVLLNGALLSRIRQPLKKDLKKQKQFNIKFYSPPGSYIKILKA